MNHDVGPVSFSPLRPHRDPARERGCFSCAHFRARFFGGNALCKHRGDRQVVEQLPIGCAFSQREPAADDEQE